MRVNRRALVTAIGVLAAAVATATAVLALTSAAEPEAEGAKQRVAIVTQGVQNDPSSPVFELTPLQPGALERDSGTERSTLTGTVVMRKGQRAVLTHGVETLQGDRGTLEVVTGSSGSEPDTDIASAPARGRSCAGRASTQRSQEAGGEAICG
jgi:hypothetical protein